MSRPQIFPLIFLLLCLLAAGASLADNVTFDLEPMDRFYGTPVGMGPGDFMFSEGGADLWLDTFISSGSPYFNYAQIDPAFTGPSIYFGNLQILEINNVGVVFDFSSPGNVTFEYMDLGGSVNLQVNGYGSVLEAEDLIDLIGGVAPGVVMTATSTPFPGGHMGIVTLTGPVQRFRLGGQEFWVDNVHNDNSGDPGGDCDYEVNHQTLAVGMGWGSSYGSIPGEFIFTEDGIPVYIGEIQWANGNLGFNTCEVMVPGIAGFGFDKVMNLNNVSNLYDIGALGITTSSITFEFVDYGGTENLMVNGYNLHVGDLDLFPAAIAPGVTLWVQTWTIGGGGIRGVATLIGNVTELLVAGQEFFIDNICVHEEGGDPGDCDLVSDNESLADGMAWGSSYGDSPGDIIFSEDGINVVLEVFDHGSGTIFNMVSVGPPWCPIGDGNALHLNNICVNYELAPFLPIRSASFEFCKGGGMENLAINGMTYVGNLEEIPANFFPNAEVYLSTTTGPGYIYGTVTLVGDFQHLMVGGQEFYLDNLCVYRDLSPVPEVVAGTLILGPNFPNPFNPSTTLNFRLNQPGLVQLSVVDLAGRRIATLLDEVRSEGEHRMVWDGRDDHGRQVASGIYFVRLESGGQIATRKIEMLK